MDRKQTAREQEETMELFSERLDASTPCQTKPQRSGETAVEKVRKAVTAAADRVREKVGKRK